MGFYSYRNLGTIPPKEVIYYDELTIPGISKGKIPEAQSLSSPHGDVLIVLKKHIHLSHGRGDRR